MRKTGGVLFAGGRLRRPLCPSHNPIKMRISAAMRCNRHQNLGRKQGWEEGLKSPTKCCRLAILGSSQPVQATLKCVRERERE